MSIKIEVLISALYTLGLCTSFIQMSEFNRSGYRHRKDVRAAYIFCWAALVIPFLNLIGTAYLWWSIRKAARSSKDLYVNIGMVFPKFYERTGCQPIAQPKTGLGEDNEHA